MRFVDTCRMKNRVFTCARSDDAKRKAMAPVLRAYLAQREQDLSASVPPRLRNLREVAMAFETLQQVIDVDRLTVLVEGRVMAEPVDPVSLQHVDDDMLANLLRFVMCTNFEDGELTRPAGNKKAA